MEYKVVNIKEKNVVGISIRANNQSPESIREIGAQWEHFYRDGIYAGIEEKTGPKRLGIYTNYASDETGDYTNIVGCEVSSVKNMPEGTISLTIPSGTYAKFVVKGDLHQAISNFWSELWNMKLPRNFKCDFEEYQGLEGSEEEIHIYIGIHEN